jgi:hypothetical protein
MHKWWFNDFAGPENLGGTLGSSPAAVNWAPGADQYEDVYYMGPDHRLKHRWVAYSNGQWTSEFDYGGYMTSAPAAAYNPNFGNPREEVFYRNSTGGIDYLLFGALPYGPYTWLPNAGVYSGSNPAAAVLGNTTFVYWRNSTNSHLMRAKFPETTIVDTGQPAALESGPAAAAWGDGRVDIVARTNVSSFLTHTVWQEDMPLTPIPQERSNWCWAAVDQIIADRWGFSYSQCYLAEHVFNLPNYCCRYPGTCNWGNNNQPWAWMGFSWNETPYGSVLSQQDIERQVIEGRPWFHGAHGHAMVGFGRMIYANQFWVALYDPLYGGSEYMVSYDDYQLSPTKDDYDILPHGA